jgi:hypothetical protein
MLTLQSSPVRDEQVAGKIIPSDQPGKTEAVLVLPSQGKVKVLNEVGARIWALVDGTRQVQQIVEIICSEYQVEPGQAQVDILEFLNELVEKKAIHLQEIPGG